MKLGVRFWKIPRPAQSMVVRPGETLILRYDKISPADAERVRHHVHYWGIDVKVIQADGMAVIRDAP